MTTADLSIHLSAVLVTCSEMVINIDRSCFLKRKTFIQLSHTRKHCITQLCAGNFISKDISIHIIDSTEIYENNSKTR
jgi:hypothetical protein